MTGSGGTGASEGELPRPGATPPPPPGFLAELAEAFRRHRPQGSLRWNFSDAFTRLEQHVRRPPAAGGEGPAAGDRPGRGPATVGRAVSGRLGRWVDGRAAAAARSAVDEALAEGRGATGATDAAVEAFRFLAARVEGLEDAGSRRLSPVEGMAWLVPSPALGGWAGPVARWVAGAHRSGEVVHGECGAGELAVALVASGLSVRGAEPRGAVAWEAAERGVDVHVGPVEGLLASTAPGSLGGLVLSGVVDRLDLAGLVALLETATGRLADGAPLVVVSTAPGAVGTGWDAVARDLVPGRPLHPETWALLLSRAGYVEVGPLEGPDEGPGAATYALKGRRPG